MEKEANNLKPQAKSYSFKWECLKEIMMQRSTLALAISFLLSPLLIATISCVAASTRLTFFGKSKANSKEEATALLTEIKP